MARQIERFYQNFFNEVSGKQKIEVPSCDRVVKEVAGLRIQQRGVLFVPDGLTIGHLDKMFPHMLSGEGLPAVRRFVLENWHEPVSGGWQDIENQSDAPNKGVAKSEAITLFASQGGEEQSLPVFLLASQVNKKVRDHYYDEESWTRLSNSWENGDSLAAGFSKGGQLRIARLNPEIRHSNVGARSQRKKV